MQTQELVREFKYNSVALPDPNPAFNLDQVRDFFSSVYPEILNAEIEGPVTKANKNVYTFRRAVGTKGSAPLSQMVADLTQLLPSGWIDDDEAEFVKEMDERAHAAVFKPLNHERSRLVGLHLKYCRAGGDARALGQQAEEGQNP